MKIMDIKAFLAIVKHGTISAAAKSLYISQPSITRRIQQLERELGYSLIERNQGVRSVSLTEGGAAFLQIARQWQQLLEETEAISSTSRKKALTIAAVNSVSQGVLSQILPDFLSADLHLRLYNAYSEDTYRYMAKGAYDLAFIEQQEYTTKIPPNIQSKPVFSESFVLVSKEKIKTERGKADLKSLDRKKEIYVPWNSEYKSWHSSLVDEATEPLIFLEDISGMQNYLMKDGWCIVPYTLGLLLRSGGMHLYTILDDPPERIIYCLTRGNEKVKSISMVLDSMNQFIRLLPEKRIRSFL